MEKGDDGREKDVGTHSRQQRVRVTGGYHDCRYHYRVRSIDYADVQK